MDDMCITCSVNMTLYKRQLYSISRIIDWGEYGHMLMLFLYSMKLFSYMTSHTKPCQSMMIANLFLDLVGYNILISPIHTSGE